MIINDEFVSDKFLPQARSLQTFQFSSFFQLILIIQVTALLFDGERPPIKTLIKTGLKQTHH
jgi:hypothetical protein